MIIVHHLNNSRSQRVLWLLEELGLSYEIKHYERDKKTSLAPDALKAIHPLGKSPIITDNGETIAESGAIIEYLLDRYGNGRLRPQAGSAERLRFTYWLHYAEGSAMPPLLLSLIFTKIAKAPAPFFVRPISRAIATKVEQSFIGPQLRLHLDFMEVELRKSKWFAGEEFSAADIQMSFSLEAASIQNGLMASRPALQNFLREIHARPAYQRALEKGGPYTLRL